LGSVILKEFCVTLISGLVEQFSYMVKILHIPVPYASINIRLFQANKVNIHIDKVNIHLQKQMSTRKQWLYAYEKQTKWMVMLNQ